MSELVRLDDNRQDALSLYRLSTDAATATAAIVKATAKEIKGRKFVSVEGWQAIAIAHGCIASSTDVEQVEGGVRATGLVKRASDGMVLAQAEGFVGEDEPVWYGGGRDKNGDPYPPRPMFAIRAMAQTRAISRACRSAFAHVVVMIDASLGTTPAEEMEAAIEHPAPPVQPRKPVSRSSASSQDAPSTRQTPQTAAPDAQQAAKPDDPKSKALRRLYAVMRDAGLVHENDKKETSRRALELARHALFADVTIGSVSDLDAKSLHGLADWITEERYKAFEVLGLDPLAGDHDE